MNPIISREEDLEVVRLILKVKDKLKELNDALCRIPGPDPNLPMSEYGRGAPFDYHLRFIAADRAFKSLESKLLDRLHNPMGRSMLPMMQTTSVGTLPRHPMVQEEAQYQEHNFQVVFNNWISGTGDSDVEDGVV